MKIDSRELMEEFYMKHAREKYPKFTLKMVKDACHGPWHYLAKNMEKGVFPILRLTYFGVFASFPKRLEYFKKVYDQRLKDGKMSEKEHSKMSEMIKQNLK